MESAGGSREVHPEASEHGLKEDAIGFRDALIIGIASTAPAYSLAAVIGLVVVTVGAQAPAVLLASFIPMFFVATAFYYMNRADQDWVAMRLDVVGADMVEVIPTGVGSADITALAADRIVREILGGIVLHRNGTSQQQKEEG